MCDVDGGSSAPGCRSMNLLCPEPPCFRALAQPDPAQDTQSAGILAGLLSLREVTERLWVLQDRCKAEPLL